MERAGLRGGGRTTAVRADRVVTLDGDIAGVGSLSEADAEVLSEVGVPVLVNILFIQALVRARVPVSGRASPSPRGVGHWLRAAPAHCYAEAVGLRTTGCPFDGLFRLAKGPTRLIK